MAGRRARRPLEPLAASPELRSLIERMQAMGYPTLGGGSLSNNWRRGSGDPKSKTLQRLVAIFNFGWKSEIAQTRWPGQSLGRVGRGQAANASSLTESPAPNGDTSSSIPMCD